jgi:hypothetical protein
MTWGRALGASNRAWRGIATSLTHNVLYLPTSRILVFALGCSFREENGTSRSHVPVITSQPGPARIAPAP